MSNEIIHEKTGIAADSAGRTVIGHLGELRPGSSLSGVKAVRVVVEQTGAADADFNIELGGSDLFNAEQSVDAADTAEGLTPDQNKYASDETDQIAVDVSSAGSGGSELHITVVGVPA